MFVGYARYDLRLSDCRTLKDKRSVVRSLQSLLLQKFRCSVGEVDHQDLRQRTAVGVSVVTPTSFHAKKMLQQIGRHVESHPGVEIISVLSDVLSAEDE